MFFIDNMKILFHVLGKWKNILIFSTKNNTYITWSSEFLLVFEKQFNNKPKIKNRIHLR